MEDRKLFTSTGHEQIDRVLREAISRFECAFPGRIRACYIEGSYASGTGIATSDLDLTIVFGAHFESPGEREAAEQLCKAYAAERGVAFDAEFVDEASLREGVSPQFKLGSQLLSGEDIREQCLLIAIERWTQERMHAAYWLTIRVFHRPAVVRLPLPAPDPSDQFFGYANRKVRLPDGSEVLSTRNLVRTTGWAATALVALQAKQYVATKRNCHTLYRNYIGDEWAGFLEELYAVCRGEWTYLIPQSLEDQQRLRNICERALAFENHFLILYKGFVLAELRNTNEAGKAMALRVLRDIPYDDEEIIDTVRALATMRYDS